MCCVSLHRNSDGLCSEQLVCRWKVWPGTVFIKLTVTDQAAEMLLLLCFYAFKFEFFPQCFFFAVLGRSQPHLDDFEHARYYTSQPSPSRQVPKPEHSPKGRIKPMVTPALELLWSLPQITPLRTGCLKEMLFERGRMDVIAPADRWCCSSCTCWARCRLRD